MARASSAAAEAAPEWEALGDAAAVQARPGAAEADIDAGLLVYTTGPIYGFAVTLLAPNCAELIPAILGGMIITFLEAIALFGARFHTAYGQTVFVASPTDQGLWQVKRVAVQTGEQWDERVEIIDGLKEGDQVVSGPYSAISKTLKEGTAIKKVDKTELFMGGKK